MKVGVTVPNMWGVEDAQQMLAMGPLAERLGFDSVWVMDHLFHTGFVTERLGTRPYWHPLAVLSHLSATTSRVALGTGVLVLPYHDPIEMAKYFATLDHMSGGRVIAGVGVGALAPEFEALGIQMKERGARTTEAIRLMRELWTGTPTFKSARFDIKDVGFYPEPVQSPLPIWVGGSSEGARRRAALHGDGWLPNGMHPDTYAALAAEVRATAAEAGRDPSALSMNVLIQAGVRGETGGDSAHTTTIWADDADVMRALLQGYREAGVEHAVVALQTGDVALLTKAMECIAGVLADVR